MIKLRSFFAELKRRNVYKVAVAYAVVAWLLIQIATQTFPFFQIPDWATRLVILLLIFGFPVALVLAWAFELTPGGIKRTEEVAPNEFITGQTGLEQMQPQPAEARRDNLPAQLSSFVGREGELREIKQLLTQTRLLTLTGAGGCGKTRLALHVAADLVSAYADGVWLVELAPASHPDSVAQLVAKALRIQEEPQRSVLETLADRLRSKRLLLIFDNCEHLLDASATVAAGLLRTCSHLRILATSREALGVAGETIWQVPSLAAPEPGATMSPELLGQFEAVRLFTDRAVAVQPRFALTSATAAAVGEICWRLDGIPLAIELAAARMSALSAAETAQRLQDSFELLSQGNRTAMPHHQTLRATIDWSYALLTGPERSLFQRLAVFAGGFDLMAAENVCVRDAVKQEQILDLLSQLVGKSLVLASEQAGTSRYRLLEPIRQYAQDRLQETGGMAAVQRRHADYFLGLAQKGETRMLGRDQRLACDALEVEHANLLIALAWAVEHERETALKLSNALGWFWEKRGSMTEGREWIMKTIAQSPVTSVNRRAEAYVRAGRLACWQGDYEDAVALTEQGLRLCEESGNRRWIGLALNNLGGIAAYRGELSRAGPLLEQSLSIGKELGDDDLVWRSIGDLAVVAAVQGNYERARDLSGQALLISRQRGDEEAEMICLRALGDVECACGNSEKAVKYFEETLAAGRKLGHKRAIAGALEGLGKIAFDQGDYARAGAFYEQGLRVVNEMGQKSLYRIPLDINLAELAAEERRYDDARKLSMTALRNSQDVGDKESIPAALALFAWLCFVSAGQPQTAAQLLGAVEGFRQTLGFALPPRERARHERRLAAIRGALDEEAFAAAWARGKAMTVEDALAYACGREPNE